MKSVKTPEALDLLKSERDELSGKIKSIRQELFYAHDIFDNSPDVERQLRQELKLRSERLLSEQPKNMERGKMR